MPRIATTTLIALLAMFPTASSLRGAAQPDAPPNVIYIMLDEWGYYEWSGAGHRLLDTPHIDRLANEGMRFTQMLAGSAACGPTRSALLTGQHTGHTTVRSNDGTEPIREEDFTLGELFKQAGYATGGFGKWGIGDRGSSGVPERHGFDEFFGYYNQVHAHTYYPNYLVHNGEKVPLAGNTGHAFEGETFSQYLIHDKAKAFIKEHAGQRPFFAYLPYTIPHAYYGIPEDDPSYLKYKDKKWDSPPHHPGRRDIAPPDEPQRYAAFVDMADRQIGEIMALVQSLGIDDNTLIFLSGDNGGNQKPFSNEKYPRGFFGPNVHPKTGVYFRGGKGNLYEGGLRVPYFVRWPGKIKPGTESDHLGYFPDVMPTLAEIIGAAKPETTDGISFAPTLLGDGKQKEHEYLYWEYKNFTAVRHGKWKAIRTQPNAPFELYDLSQDISETTDLAAKNPKVLERLKRFAEEAHEPDTTGTVYDASLGFEGHRAK